MPSEGGGVDGWREQRERGGGRDRKWGGNCGWNGKQISPDTLKTSANQVGGRKPMLQTWMSAMWCAGKTQGFHSGGDCDQLAPHRVSKKRPSRLANEMLEELSTGPSPALSEHLINVPASTT